MNLRSLLQYAVLAPSGHNTQPWLFRVADDHIDLFADRKRRLPVVDPDDRELIISCGAALMNLRLAMTHSGYQPLVAAFPDPGQPDLLARVSRGAATRPGELEEALFLVIPVRHTNRHRFEDRPLPAGLAEALREAAEAEGAWLHPVEREAERHELANLIAEGDRLQGADAAFRRELAEWVHPNRSDSRDGLPGYAQGMGDLLSYLGPFVVRTFDWGTGQAAMDRQLAEGSPGLTVLGTPEDYPAAWLAAGQALQRVLLRLRVDGVSASFLNQPVETRELRGRLRSLIGAPGYPQLVLRFGYGPQVKATPRRELDEVVI